MADYPTFHQMEGSTFEYDDNVVALRDSGGAARSSSFFDDVKRRFQIRHLLNTTDLEELQTFYETNKVLPFNFTWALDSTPTVRVCIFGSGRIRVSPGGVFHNVTVDIWEV